MNSELRPQRTISRPASVAGFGYWSGRDVQLEFRPAPANSGIVFVRRDLPQPSRVAALVRYRVETPRRTSLSFRGTSVEMIEHVMAALAGLQIDNCEVWVDRPEIPGCDGSSAAFVAALDAAGVVEQAEQRTRYVIKRTIRVGADDCWIEASPVNDDSWTVCYDLDYGEDGPIGRQSCELSVTPESFRAELAGARTVVLQEEADWMRKRGVGNRVTPRDLLVFDRQGPIDNALRFPNECARHKALDLVGDLSLLGMELVGRVRAYRAGHKLNAELVRALLADDQEPLSQKTDESERLSDRIVDFEEAELSGHGSAAGWGRRLAS
ncbi:MAG: UDP-3-O-acyl-N-acetylglucosamine deacetylase [Planctomycetota bacterium]